MRTNRFHEMARLLSIGVLFVCVIGFYLITLISLQIAGQDYYTMSSDIAYYSRTVTIKAQRGEIFDRNGTPLVVNSYSYQIQLDGGSTPTKNSELNQLLLQLMNQGEDNYHTPDSPFSILVENDELFCEYVDSYLSTVYGKRFNNLLKSQTTTTKNPNGKTVSDLSATNACFVFLYRYGLCEKDYETLCYPIDEVLRLLPLRIDMETHNFSSNTPYTILTNVSVEMIAGLLETTPRGITVVTTASREYLYPGVASHILGRVGKIQASNAEYYTEKGYPLDAIVGLSGVEYSFEDTLRGIDGVITIIEDSYGNIISQSITKEPVPGSDVYLTLDLEYQIAAENALKSNIEYIVNKGLASGVPYSGEDADAGALTMIDVKTGEILAIASYPTYDLCTFSQDYSSLVSNTSLPLLNRALYGQYPPGSTFKVGVAATALMENVLTPSTELLCEGVYSYYQEAGFSPSCWIHAEQYGWRNHGLLQVNKAIQDSCNCFFYETGRLCGIDLLNRYSKVFGFGQNTGIELGESVGVLAGPEYRESIDGESWSPGDTCQAAIGQSDNLVTPLQLSVYISTIINSGSRIKATIINSVKSFDGTEISHTTPAIVDKISISKDIRALLLDAMKNVTDYGSAARVFSEYPIMVGGKTGTAQRLENESAYATFTAFAPFDDPEIVVSCIIERGANGTDAGFAVRDMFNIYFGVTLDDSANS